MPADVADREHDPTVGQQEGVVPVAADLTGVVLGGEVARRDVERVERGEAGPDQRLLEDLHRASLPGQAFPRREQRRLGRPLFGDVLERAAYRDDPVRLVEQDLAPVHHLADVAVDEEPALHHVTPPATPECLIGRSGELGGVVGMRGALQRVLEIDAAHGPLAGEHAGHLRRQRDGVRSCFPTPAPEARDALGLLQVADEPRGGAQL